ncbi:LysM peptidoglycan-binding domain-containing protein [Actinoplanes sp. NPDC051851]|uniref:LysM peptidoglycan-binding domain-containing protein n=1 Tax=Actinoplanes sp. NPDC051851 TaxID=3154753 RepID=UPI00342769BF
MPRLGHGKPITKDDIAAAQKDLAEGAARSPVSFALTKPVDTHRFDLLFPGLQDDEANLLPEAANTPELLKRLGATMTDDDTPGADSPIPAAYTYFGQFVDHDITLETQREGDGSGTLEQLLDPDMTPLPLAQVRNALVNRRTGTLDLDSLYVPPAVRDPHDQNRMLIGDVSPVPQTNPPSSPTQRPPGKGNDNDLPREPPRTGTTPEDLEHDRAAKIGDARNDENLIISQLHVAFLKAHNALVDRGMSFESARRTLRQHYQHIVVHDFLKKVAEKSIVDDIVTHGNHWYDGLDKPFFMPLEFSFAAYRFGHTMVRAVYDFNLNFTLDSVPIKGTLDFLFTFTALSGQLGGPQNKTLPENWIIQWERIIGGKNPLKARKLDTRVAATRNRALFNLQTVDGKTVTPPDGARLSVRNLLRGYRMRLPTGQALAQHLGLPVLGKDELLAAAGSPDQVNALQAGGFESRTPLWYYVLAEAQHHHKGDRLGPLGSTLVAEVLIGLVRRSEDSILAAPGWKPSLPSEKPGVFELPDLLRLAGVLEGRKDPDTYKVKKGDTLTGIAQSQLGDGKRWPQIYVLNRASIRNPNRIIPGQVFLLPPRQPVGRIPKLYTVKRGDSLFRIAQAELGNGNRWPDIFALNRDIITNPDRIIPGQILILPS